LEIILSETVGIIGLKNPKVCIGSTVEDLPIR